MIDIRDVPCESCQNALTVRHSCDVPRHCPCNLWRDHINEEKEEKTQMATKTVMILETKAGPEIQISRKSDQDYIEFNDSEISLPDVKTLIKLLARAADLPRSWGGKEDD